MINVVKLLNMVVVKMESLLEKMIKEAIAVVLIHNLVVVRMELILKKVQMINVL